jgi:inhibitor of cysteine peptidase
MKGQATIVILAVLLVSLLFIVTIYPNVSSPSGELKRFSSYSDLENFLKANTESYTSGTFGVPLVATRQSVMETTADSGTKSESAPAAGGEASSDYSTTNIQVEGVDEADIVKNDGKYIYAVSGSKVVIVDAYPAENAGILSEIEPEGYPQEIFVDGDRLIIFGNSNYYSSGVSIPEIGIVPRYSSGTFINVYDITDRTNPVLKRNVTVDGNYYDSRMIGNYVYAITSQSVYYGGGPVPMPTIRSGSSEKTLAASDIYYFDYPDYSYTFTNIVSVNTQNDAEEVSSKTFLLGYTQNLYVSPNSIYIVYTKRLSEVEYYDRIIDQAVIPNVPITVQTEINQIRNSDKEDYEKMQEIGNVVQEYVQSLGPEQGATVMKKIEEDVQQVYQDISKEIEKTVVHKISISNGNIEYLTSGEVPGYTLNQFSMDEYNGYFRIATTTGNWRAESLNHVYVLDASLNIVGKLEDLAHGERIYSVRFMADKAYMVTFRQIDPLFVIDMSNPANPQVLGYLKVPGVSDYLHPYDDTHIIGVGNNATEQGRINGLKLSLFDVSDFSNPKEISTYVIGGDGTYASSDALYDHKAFLFDKDKQLMVIPVSINTYSSKLPYEYDYWQGAYVFNIDLANGISLKGKVTHENETNNTYYDYNAQIRRSLYIDNVLYTVSNSMIKANSLADLVEISKVDLPVEDQYGYVRGMSVGVAIADVAVE